MSTVALIASTALDNVPEYRPYSEADRPDGKVGLKFYEEYVQSYSGTSTRPHFVLAWQVNALANTLRSDTFATSNPLAILNHPAFQTMQWLGSSTLPLLLKRLDREPTLWLTALPVLVGASPVRAESRGRIRAMIADWREWARQNGVGDAP